VNQPLVSRTFTLKKIEGKGGWTYAEVPEIPQDKSSPFGWVCVKGSIDDYPFEQFKLMPMGNGKLFFSVKKAIRKKIGKEAGDTVYITLYPDYSKTKIPAEIIQILDHEDPRTNKLFNQLKDGDKKAFIDWIYEAKTEDTIVNRIVLMIEKVRAGKKHYDKL